MRPGNGPRTTTGITRKSVVVHGRPIEEMPDWLRQKVYAELPADATLVGVSDAGFSYTRSGHHYDRNW